MKDLIILIIAIAILPLGLSQDSKGCLSKYDDMKFPKTLRSDLYRGQQAFTVSMLDTINKATPDQNVFFSPYSTYHALLLAYFGAQNATEAELMKVLNLNWSTNKNHVRQAYRVEKRSRADRSTQMLTEFKSADKIFFSKNSKLKECMQNFFHEELKAMDFVNNAEQSREDINKWVANITNNEIPELLSQGDITSQTNLVLANAAYFKGQWASKFDPNDSHQEIFYTATDKQAFVNMMHKRGTYKLATDERLKAHILEMPYATENDTEPEISMVVILPPFTPNGLEKVLENLNPDTLEMALKDGMLKEIDISLPKFEFKQELDLVPILKTMGAESLFTDDADLTGFSPENELKLGEAKHVAKIKVDEQGSTASAATVFFSFRSARPIEPTKFECNHPFMFLIFDHKSKAILFTGIYRDPKTQK